MYLVTCSVSVFVDREPPSSIGPSYAVGSEYGGMGIRMLKDIRVSSPCTSQGTSLWDQKVDQCLR